MNDYFSRSIRLAFFSEKSPILSLFKAVKYPPILKYLDKIMYQRADVCPLLAIYEEFYIRYINFYDLKFLDFHSLH